MILIGIFGAGGYAREVMPVARNAAARKFPGQQYELVFVVANNDGCGKINGHRVLTEFEFYAYNSGDKYFNVAIADSRLREKIVNDALSKDVKAFGCCADNVIVMDENEIGEGVILSPSVIITSNARIGRFFHANLFSYIAHDCQIGDFVTFAPNVHCNGNVIVRDHAYLGTGAIIKHGNPDKPLVIGEGAVIGMGAVVTKDVLPNSVVVGNPARVLDRQGK